MTRHFIQPMLLVMDYLLVLLVFLLLVLFGIHTCVVVIVVYGGLTCGWRDR